MGDELDVSLSSGPIQAVAIPVTTTDVTPFNGSGALYGWSMREASGELPSDARASAVAPAALTTIAATVALPAGIYDVAWSVELQGAAAAADANNFQLLNGVTVVVGSNNQGAAGVYQQPNVRLTVAQGATVSIQNVGAGTAGVTYTGDLAVTPDPFFGASVELQGGNQPLGESGMDLQDSDTQWFGSPGVAIEQKVTVHVVSGTVTGVLYIAPDY